MKKILYRVECNYGSKYFDNGIEAFAYFNLRKKQRQDVEIWLVVFEDNKKLFSVKQELLDFNLPRCRF